MIRCLKWCGVSLWLAAGAFGQLSPEQKLADFQHLAGLYAKNYAPYEWKAQTQNFDLLDLTSWVNKVNAAKTDLDFYEVMVAYVASLNDAHDVYQLPSVFVARLNFTTDIYDGKVLVDSINRSRLPAADFPFQIGDEVVSIDGRPVEDWLKDFIPYSTAANPLSSRRTAASFLPVRPQALMPHAVDLGDAAVVQMRSASGELATYHIPWTKTGLPLAKVGPVPVLASVKSPRAASAGEGDADPYTLLDALQWCHLPDRAVLNEGGRTPIFRLPDGFTQRLGRASSDVFYSGTFQADGLTIGFIRIPDYAPLNVNAALQQFITEMAYFQQNTDGLIIDEMRNPGGSAGYLNILVQFLMPARFNTVGFEVRATSIWVAQISSALESARATGEPAWVLDLLGYLFDQVSTANRENRGRTGPIPLDDLTLDREPARDPSGRLMAYTKPLMVLVDEMSASGGDLFPATIQINQRGPVFGMRTMGAGGSVSGWNAGVYSEGSTSITISLMNRGQVVSIPGYPDTAYIENVGVQPDIVADYMTRDNLLNGGRTFVNAFVAAMVDHIRGSR